jgi:hypothetical protein
MKEETRGRQGAHYAVSLPAPVGQDSGTVMRLDVIRDFTINRHTWSGVTTITYISSPWKR